MKTHRRLGIVLQVFLVIVSALNIAEFYYVPTITKAIMIVLLIGCGLFVTVRLEKVKTY